MRNMQTEIFRRLVTMCVSRLCMVPGEQEELELVLWIGSEGNYMAKLTFLSIYKQ